MMRTFLIPIAVICTLLPVSVSPQEIRSDLKSAMARIVVPPGGIRLTIEDPGPAGEDPWCDYEPSTGTCTVLDGSVPGGVSTSQPSASDCFALCERPSTADASCQYKPATNTCFAALDSEDGWTFVGASVPDGHACADHCAANGIE